MWEKKYAFILINRQVDPKSNFVKLMSVTSSRFVDLAVLSKYRDRKLIRTQTHPYLPLCIHNYTELCQYTKAWDDITKLCRGLITDDDGNIVARSFRKFFNYKEECDDHVPTDDFVVQDKMDGSLMMVFWYENAWRTASRGSFTSPQAIKAREMLDSRYRLEYLEKCYTYVFEIIYPENRIVVDYGRDERLVFLACFDKDGIENFDQISRVTDCNLEVVKEHPFDDFTTIQNLNWAGAEGFVVRFSNGHRVKIKFQNYIDLHRVVTNLTPKSVWTMYKTQMPLEKCLQSFPDEWHQWFNSLWQQIDTEYKQMQQQITDEFTALYDPAMSRRDFALAIKDHEHKKFFFNLADGKTDLHDTLCSTLDATLLDTISESKGPSSVVHKHSAAVTTPPELVIMVGISASGKSWRAREIARASHRHVIVSRDDLRKTLFGYAQTLLNTYYVHPLLQKREEIVTRTEASMIRSLLQGNTSVIVDDTNCSLSTLNKIVALGTGYQIRFEVMEENVDHCILRDKMREYTVGETVIRKQLDKFNHLKVNFNFEAPTATLNQISSPEDVPDCFIFDVDGTLALNTSGRDWYDWDSVTEDSICTAVRDCAISLHEAGYRIIVCSGRDECCLHETADWLRSYHVPFDEIHFRAPEDNRKDAAAKEDMWRDIAQRYRIRALFDDRQSVVDHARSLGLQVFQVAQTMV